MARTLRLSFENAFYHITARGISSPYEVPDSPEIHIKTDECTVVDEAVEKIVKYLKKGRFI